MKTLYISVVNHRTRTTIVKEGNRIYPASGDKSRYLLIPQDGVISKPAELFSQEIHMVGRVCWADQKINATAAPSSSPLFQTFTLQIPGNMSIIESCPNKDSWSSQNWTIASHTKLELPITCKITSRLFNCSAISLRSAETKEVHFPHHKMTILEQHWDEEATDANNTEFTRHNVTVEPETSILQSLPSLPSISQLSNLKTPLLCAGGIVILIIIVGVSIKLTTNRSPGGLNVNVATTNNVSSDNNASNDNKMSNDNNASNDTNVSNDNTASNDSSEIEILPPTAPVQPQPPLNFAEVPIADILDKKASRRNGWERQMVDEYIRRKKALEASQN